ncbi:MAG: hypothetical protein ACTSYD_01215 [Candidatus Heimdallarchaeaceae archaeon]
MSEESRYYLLKISPFHLPFLRDLGIKAVAMITFDLMYGPVAYINELSRSNFVLKLKDKSSLGELYAGFARTGIDIITIMDEQIVVANYTVSVDEETESNTILLFVCVPSANLEKISQYARSLAERTRGDPEAFNGALKILIESEKKEAHKIVLTQNGKKHKGMTIKEPIRISPTVFQNFYGFIFFQYYKGVVDARFFPTIMGGKRIDLYAFIKFIDAQRYELNIPLGELVSLYYQGIELFVYNYRQKDALFVVAKRPQSKVNYNYMQMWFEYFFSAYVDVQGSCDENAILETLQYLDKNISKSPKKYIIREIFDIMLHIERDIPELTTLPSNIKKKGWVTLHKDFQLFLENLHVLNGDTTVYQISQILSVPVSKVIDFIIFLKSRNCLEIYRRNEK